jgi:hypothetical protein
MTLQGISWLFNECPTGMYTQNIDKCSKMTNRLLHVERLKMLTRYSQNDQHLFYYMVCLFVNSALIYHMGLGATLMTRSITPLGGMLVHARLGNSPVLWLETTYQRVGQTDRVYSFSRAF